MFFKEAKGFLIKNKKTISSLFTRAQFSFCRNRKNKPYSLETKIKSDKCNQPYAPVILANGDVYLCCKRPTEGYMHNIFDDNFVFNSELKESGLKRALNCCKNCTVC
jgi:hypothetical protein